MIAFGRRGALALLCAAAVGLAAGQYYPYGYPTGYPYGYQYDPTLGGMYGMPYYPTQGGNQYDPTLGGMYGMPYYPTQGGMYNANLDPMAQMDLIGQQIQAKLDEYNKYFIDLYRKTTGDTTSPDSYALQMGQAIHCQQNPLDCQLAYQGSKAAQASQQASFDAWMAGVQQRDAANDAAMAAWWQQQQSQEAGVADFNRTVIREEAQYTDPGTGTTYDLPYAPSQNTYYQTPTGLPLVFDPAFNVWYQINPDGSRTPYYGAP